MYQFGEKHPVIFEIILIILSFLAGGVSFHHASDPVRDPAGCGSGLCREALPARKADSGRGAAGVKIFGKDIKDIE